MDPKGITVSACTVSEASSGSSAQRTVAVLEASHVCLRSRYRASFRSLRFYQPGANVSRKQTLDLDTTFEHADGGASQKNRRASTLPSNREPAAAGFDSDG